jgi:hypothetical protein
MLKKFEIAEILILVAALVFIFVAEYYYVVLGDHDRAIFLGLWPPTMILLVIYINSKKQNQNG